MSRGHSTAQFSMQAFPSGPLCRVDCAYCHAPLLGAGAFRKNSLHGIPLEFDENEAEPIVTPDTPNATKFHPEEAPEGDRYDGSESFYHHYKLLRNMNRGTHERVINWLWKANYDNKQSRYYKNLAIYDSIACQLDLPGRQKRWGTNLFKQLDFKRFSKPNAGGMGIALAAFCACSYVCWQCDWRTHPNHPDRNPHFRKIQEKLDFSNSELHTWYGRFENIIRTPNRPGEGGICNSVH